MQRNVRNQPKQSRKKDLHVRSSHSTRVSIVLYVAAPQHEKTALLLFKAGVKLL